MLVIWGVRARYKTLDDGTFSCPNEGGDRRYERKEARRWFTLFWIPLIPLNILGDLVECQSCRHSYDPRVLTQPTTAQMMDNLATAMRHAVVAMANAGGPPDDARTAAALDVMQRYADTPYTDRDLKSDLRSLNHRELDARFALVADTLNGHGKEQLLTACLEIAVADGSIGRAQLEQARRIGSALGMSPAHVRGVISTAEERLLGR